MGVARQLRSKKQGVKDSARLIAKEFVFTKGRNLGRILGPYISWRNPMRFYYAKSRRRANVKRALEGMRNFYSYCWKRMLMPKKFFSSIGIASLNENKASAIFRSKKEQELREKPMEAKGKKEKPIVDRLTSSKPGKADAKVEAVSCARTEKPRDVRVEPAYAPPKTKVPAKKVEAKTPKEEKSDIQRTYKQEDNRVERIKVVDYKPAVGKVVEAPTVKTAPEKHVSKGGEQGSKIGNIYKIEYTTEKPRTSSGETHAKKSVWVGEQPFITSNLGQATDVALPVRPFSLFVVSAKVLKMKPEGIIRTGELKIQKPEKRNRIEHDEHYHKMNRARNRILFPKMAGAAGSVV